MARRRLGWKVIVCALTLIGSWALQPVASAQESAPESGPTTVELANQEVLSGLRTWMMDQPEFAAGEYISSTDDLDARSSVFLWYGTGPFREKVRAEAEARGISLTFRESKFSQKQLTAASNAILSAQPFADVGGLVPQVVVGDYPGFDGIVVKVAYPDGGLSEGRSADTAQLKAFTDQATALTGYPTRVDFGDVYHAGTTRDTDTAAYNAGGFMINGGHICSSGFSITISGTTHTTTARHCSYTPYKARDLSTSSYGNSFALENVTGLRYLTATGYHWMFDGPYNTSAHKTVTGYTDVGVGDWVFTAGGNSGTHVNLKVNWLNGSWNDGYGTIPLIDASNPNNTVSFAAGDSGGPVFGYHTDNVTVGAAGSMQAYATTPTGGCGSMRDANPCGSHTGFSSIHAAVNLTSGASLTL